MGELQLPMTKSFLFSYEAQQVTDETGVVIGLRKVDINITMEGKATVNVGGSRKPAGWIPGVPKFGEIVLTWEATWWTEYKRKHPVYGDEILDRTFAWLTKAREESLQFIGLSFMGQKQSDQKGHDGALERETTWEALDCKQFVDGVEIPMLQEGVL